MGHGRQPASDVQSCINTSTRHRRVWPWTISSVRQLRAAAIRARSVASAASGMATMNRLVVWAPTDNRALPTLPTTSSPPRMRLAGGVPGGVAQESATCGARVPSRMCCWLRLCERTGTPRHRAEAPATPVAGPESAAALQRAAGQWEVGPGRSPARAGRVVLGWDTAGWEPVCAALVCGDPRRLEALVRSRPRTELRGGLREDHAHGNRALGGPSSAKHPALPPELAAPVLSAPCIQRGERLGRFRARGVGGVDDQGARGDAMVPHDDPPTGPQECGPRQLAVSKPPGPGRQGMGAEAGALTARPAHGVGDQHGGATKRPPGPRRGSQRVARMRRAHGLMNGGTKGAHAGGWLSKNPRRLQAIGGPHDHRA